MFIFSEWCWMVCVWGGERNYAHASCSVTVDVREQLWISICAFCLVRHLFFLPSAVCVRLAGPQGSAHCSVCIFHLPKVRALEMLDLQTHLTMVLNFASVLGILTQNLMLRKHGLYPRSHTFSLELDILIF